METEPLFIPSISAIKANREQIQPWIVTTPIWQCRTDGLLREVGLETKVFFKLELWQLGDGGLCAGIAVAMKQLAPTCKVFGVEPEGADTMYQSIHSGKPVVLEKVHTIAKSLAAPYTTPYTFSMCHRFVDEIVRVSDQSISNEMTILFQEMKLAGEPAAAAPLAALYGPLKERLQGKRVVLVLSGTNIDVERFFQLINKNKE